MYNNSCEQKYIHIILVILIISIRTCMHINMYHVCMYSCTTPACITLATGTLAFSTIVSSHCIRTAVR